MGRVLEMFFNIISFYLLYISDETFVTISCTEQRTEKRTYNRGQGNRDERKLLPKLFLHGLGSSPDNAAAICSGKLREQKWLCCLRGMMTRSLPCQSQCHQPIMSVYELMYT